jgi:DNA-directed RNA polymerase subunit RPC12/RpoP
MYKTCIVDNRVLTERVVIMKNNLTIFCGDYAPESGFIEAEFQFELILQDSSETSFKCGECKKNIFKLCDGAETIRCINCGKPYRIKVTIDVLDDE